MRKAHYLLLALAIASFTHSLPAVADNTYHITIGDEPGTAASEAPTFTGTFFSGVENYTVSPDDLPSGAKNLLNYADAWDNRTTKINSFPHWVNGWDDHIEFFTKGSTVNPTTKKMDDTNHYLFNDQKGIKISEGDKLRVYVSHNGWHAAGYVKSAHYRAGFPGIVNGADAFYIGGAKYYEISLTAAAVDSLQSHGLCLGGFDHKIIGVYYIPGDGSVDDGTSEETTTAYSGTVRFQKDSSDWGTVTVPGSCFANAKVGDKITVNLNSTPISGELKMSTGGQQIIRELYVVDTGEDTDNDDENETRGEFKTKYDFSSDKAPYFGYIRSKTILRNLQEQGLKLEGWGYNTRSITLSHSETFASDVVILGNVSFSPSANYTKNRWYGFIFPYDITGEDNLRSFFGLANTNEVPITCSSWEGHNVFLPTVSKGDVISVSGTAEASAQLQSYVDNSGTSYILIGKSTEWKGVSVSEGPFTESYTVASEAEATLINAQGGMTIGGKNLSVTGLQINGSSIVGLGGQLCIDTLSTVTYDQTNQCYNLRFARVTDYSKAILANRPYIVKFNQDVSQLKFSATSMAAEEREAVTRMCQIVDTQSPSVYIALGGVEDENSTLTSTNDFYFAGGELYRSSGSTTVKGGRAYIEATDVSSNAKINIAGFHFGENIDSTVTTYINTYTNNVTNKGNGKGAVYTLQGQKLAEGSWGCLRKGIYIVNGKKTVIP